MSTQAWVAALGPAATLVPSGLPGHREDLWCVVLPGGKAACPWPRCGLGTPELSQESPSRPSDPLPPLDPRLRPAEREQVYFGGTLQISVCPKPLLSNYG